MLAVDMNPANESLDFAIISQPIKPYLNRTGLPRSLFERPQHPGGGGRGYDGTNIVPAK
jgi:hypothetical protein